MTYIPYPTHDLGMLLLLNDRVKYVSRFLAVVDLSLEKVRWLILPG